MWVRQGTLGPFGEERQAELARLRCEEALEAITLLRRLEARGAVLRDDREARRLCERLRLRFAHVDERADHTKVLRRGNMCVLAGLLGDGWWW